MKFTCTQENLHRGLSKIHGISGQNISLPILKNILLETTEGALKIKSTDLEIGIITQVRGKVEKEGKTTVDAKIVSGFVSLLPQDKTVLNAQDHTLLIKGGSHQTKINTLSAEDYPVIPDVDRSKGFTVRAQELQKALNQILPAVSLDDTRPEINGVYWKAQEAVLILAGTDSYRLAEKRIKLADNPEYSGQQTFQRSFIVPLKTVKELVRIFNDEDEVINIYIAENQVLFASGLTEMVSRLVEGEYPDYQQIIPNSFSVKFSLSRADFINAVKISGLFAEVGSNNISLELKPQQNKIIISSVTSQGEERTDLDVSMEGEADLKIVFDYRYLLDGLNSIESEDVVFTAASQTAPAVLKPMEQSESFLYVVMPVRQ